MSKLRLLVELDYDDEVWHGDDQGACYWFVEKVLRGDGLILHDNGAGDDIGTVKVLQIEPNVNPASQTLPLDLQTPSVSAAK